jgi:chloride channel protein, CIC family
MHQLKTLYQRIAFRLRTRLNKMQYMLMVASLVGLVSGLAAVLLKTIVHYLQQSIGSTASYRFAYLLFPSLGLLLVAFIIHRFFHDKLQRGIAMVLRAIARRSSYIPLSHSYLHILTSSITVGLGGSAGLEAPIVATGAAIGSNAARINELDYRDRTLLIACGAAAGIAAVFNAPIAGVIFAIELLLAESVVSYFIPLITSAVIGALCSKIILQESILFNFVLKQNFDYHNVPFYIVLGLLAGFVSLYYARSFKGVEKRLHNWKANRYGKALTGGLLLLCIFFVLPPLFSEGYASVRTLASGDLTSITDNTTLLSQLDQNTAALLFAALIIIAKPIAAGITIGSGGNGGNFAPSLFTGAWLGFFFARLTNIFPWFKIPESNFSLVGMAGVLSGVMYCPLTAIFLIAEITNGYELIIPLMIVSSISYFIVKHYEPYSMETKQLALEGEIFTEKKEQNILTSITLAEMVSSDYQSIGAEKKLKDLAELVKQSEKNIFAVHDHKERFAGIIELNDVKKQLFQPELFEKTLVRQLMKRPAGIIREGEAMTSVMEKFDVSQSWYLPVLNQERKFTGFISKTKLFEKYRQLLAQQGDHLYDDTMPENPSPS